MRRRQPIEYTALTVSEQNRAINAAYDNLPDDERAKIKKQAGMLMDGCANRKRMVSGLGIGGALEILAKLGIWLDANPMYAREAEQMLERWEPDDLKPEERR